MAELVEGARLESEYMGVTCVEGSNPSLSAREYFRAEEYLGLRF